jgi:RTX calcium-binding nonapeptide repeat (4 copies)
MFDRAPRLCDDPLSNGGTAAINLVGNNFAQTIIGNAGANIINGLGGADTMQGLGGNDRYYVDNAADVIVERPAAAQTRCGLRSTTPSNPASRSSC